MRRICKWIPFGRQANSGSALLRRIKSITRQLTFATRLINGVNRQFPKHLFVRYCLKELCSERGINTNELATRSGVTPSTAYSMMDKNRRDISIATIKKFCDGLEITLGEFFSTPSFDSLEQEIE